MTVPPRLIGLTAKIFGDFYTHSDIDSRFAMCGYQGDPPEGNKAAKIQSWLTRGNRDMLSPLDSFYELIEEFMEIDDKDRPITTHYSKFSTVGDGQNSFREAFKRCGIAYPKVEEIPDVETSALLSGYKIIPKNPTKPISIPKVTKPPRSASGNNKVFIVHGHNEAFLQKTARTIEKLGLVPIILSEQADGGKTIIEKFETHSDVGFAVIIMSADDEGGKVGSSLRPRARQNVVLELGYFFGALKRDRVCVLKEKEVEAPSDILGVVYKELDSGGHWRFQLAGELKHAGYEVDTNALI